MDSFLGVPIRVRGEVFGNLYLTDSRRASSPPRTRSSSARWRSRPGTAISNARLYSESRLQQRWLAASAEISAQLLLNPARTRCR